MRFAKTSPSPALSRPVNKTMWRPQRRTNQSAKTDQVTYSTSFSWPRLSVFVMVKVNDDAYATWLRSTMQGTPPYFFQLSAKFWCAWIANRGAQQRIILSNHEQWAEDALRHLLDEAIGRWCYTLQALLTRSSVNPFDIEPGKFVDPVFYRKRAMP